jgi:hypothetical protein
MFGCEFRRELSWAELANDVFAGTMDGEKDASGESAGDFFGWSFEGLGMGAEPDVKNAVAANPLIDAAGDSFHFGELRHRSIIARQGSARRRAIPPGNAKTIARRGWMHPNGFNQVIALN